MTALCLSPIPTDSLVWAASLDCFLLLLSSFYYSGLLASISLGTDSFTDWPLLSLSLMLRPTVSRPVCLGIKHPTGAYDQIFITCVTVTVFFLWGALSDERSGLALASAVFIGSESESLGTWDHILLSQIWDFPFRHLLRRTVYRTPRSTLPLWVQRVNCYVRTSVATSWPSIR
jgi:hypothetical protein